MKTYTICGSMRFQKEMQEAAYYLETEKDCSVLQCVYPLNDCRPSEEELKKLGLAHYRKIDLSDGIYVVNKLSVGGMDDKYIFYWWFSMRGEKYSG